MKTLKKYWAWFAGLFFAVFAFVLLKHDRRKAEALRKRASKVKEELPVGPTPDEVVEDAVDKVKETYKPLDTAPILAPAALEAGKDAAKEYDDAVAKGGPLPWVILLFLLVPSLVKAQEPNMSVDEDTYVEAMPVPTRCPSRKAYTEAKAGFVVPAGCVAPIQGVWRPLELDKANYVRVCEAERQLDKAKEAMVAQDKLLQEANAAVSALKGALAEAQTVIQDARLELSTALMNHAACEDERSRLQDLPMWTGISSCAACGLVGFGAQSLIGD